MVVNACSECVSSLSCVLGSTLFALYDIDDIGCIACNVMFDRKRGASDSARNTRVGDELFIKETASGATRVSTRGEVKARRRCRGLGFDEKVA